MKSPTSALLWFCWRRIRVPVFCVTVAIVSLASLTILYFNQGQSDWVDFNTILISAALGLFILGPMASHNSLGGSGKTPNGTGFPLRTEFAYPVSNWQLNLVPFLFLIAVLYSVFLGTVWLLTTMHSLPMPHSIVHFVVLEFLLVVIAIGWSTINIYESFACWFALIVLFYLDVLIPDFAFNTETGEMIVGSWASTLLPVLIICAALTLMMIGVRRQRRGDYFFHGVEQESENKIAFPLTFRVNRTPCPTSSGEAALTWQQRQFRGVANATVLGAAIGAAAVLVLMLTDARGFWDGPLELDDVWGFGFIFFCSVFVGHLASLFGISYANGVSSISTFERTLPIPTSTITFTRISVTLLCLLVAAVVEFITIIVLGSILLEDFPAIRGEFSIWFNEFTANGFFYMSIRVLLAISLVYIVSVLWGIFITWFAIKPRPMTIGFTALAIFWLLQLAYLVSSTDGVAFVDATRSVAGVHSWIISGLIVAAACCILPMLIRDSVISLRQALAITVVGILLAALNSFDLEFFGSLETNATVARTVIRHSFGLLPLVATAGAIWTQHRLRHS